MQYRFGYLAAILLLALASPLRAQVDIPQEYDKLIKHRGEITAFGNDGFGDKIDIGSGGLEIVQTDVDLPGNNALPVRVSRRFVPGNKYGGGHFGLWSLDIPYMHGIFGNKQFYFNPIGWAVPGTGADQYKRCSQFSAPPELYFQTGVFLPDEYWHGSFFHLPGAGDQELLIGVHVPTAGGPYPIVTKDGAAVRCVALATTSESGSQGEGFEVITPDGMIYTLNQMVSRPNAYISKPIDDSGLLKAGGSGTQTSLGTVVGPMAVDKFGLPRLEVIVYPIKVADRFGNYVIYTWSTANPWQLLQISASDGRQITFTYPDDTSLLVSSVSDGTHIWTYGHSGGIDTVTLPDGHSWSSDLGELFNFELHPSGGCESLNYGAVPLLTGRITAPTGATAEYTMTVVKMGRSWIPLQCVRDSVGNPIYAREPMEYFTFVVSAKKITGAGLPSAGIQWTYAYGPANGCNTLGSPACTGSSPIARTVSVTDPEGTVTRYSFGNRFAVNEGLLLKTESGWNGTSALRTVEVTYADVYAEPYSYYSQSLRTRGDAATTGFKRPQRKVVTTQQDHTFTWEVASDCSGIPYCFDAFARPTKVVKSSSP